KWFLVLELLGLIGFPIAHRLFAGLPSRGYAFAKPLALLLVGYTFWLLGSFHFLMNATSAVVFVTLAVTCASAYLAWRDRDALREFWRNNRALIIATELVFVAFYLLWVVFRAYNPDLNYTEKPMDLLFLNALMRSPDFPPRDPWLSGFAISYYYFGYLMMSLLARLSGIAASVAFNLALASIMGLAASGAYAIGYDLIALKSQIANLHPEPVEGRKSQIVTLTFPLLAALFVVVIGNLEGVVELANAHGVGSPQVYQALDIRNLPPTHQSATWMPDDNWWWWRASRVLATKDLEVIDEFPFFSFLISDMHPHVMALPFALMAVALALTTLVRSSKSEVQSSTSASNLQYLISNFHYPLILGALGFLNSWDFPTYTGLVVLAFAINRYRMLGMSGKLWRDVMRFSLFVGGAGLMLYLPFYLEFSSQAGGIKFVDFFGVRTTFPQTILFWGFFFFIVVSFVVSRSSAIVTAFARDTRWWFFGAPALVVIAFVMAFQWWAAAIAAIVLTTIIVLLLQYVNPHLAPQAATAEVLINPPLRPRPRVGLGGAYPIAPDESTARDKSGSSDDATTFALLVLAVGFALVFLVEFVFIKDSFGSRMNTVFKFYYQAWILIALASAYLVFEIATRKIPNPAQASPIPTVAWALWLALFVILFAGTLVYPIAAFATQTNQLQVVQFNPDDKPYKPTLDGTAYMQKYHAADAAAIAWLRDHAPPDAVIVEAVGGQYSDYGRVAVQTGIPTILGWAGHELQWRGNGDEGARREPDAQIIYTSRNPDELRALLTTYGVTHVFVGELERARYGNA
ncbi:MAG: DUF2298 domain-containing protein, partial [Chloroflexota bacterium]